MASSDIVLLPGKSGLVLADLPKNSPSLISEPFNPVFDDLVVWEAYKQAAPYHHRTNLLFKWTLNPMIAVPTISMSAFLPFLTTDSPMDYVDPAGSGFLITMSVLVTGFSLLGGGFVAASRMDRRMHTSPKLAVVKAALDVNRAAFVEWVKGRYGISLVKEVKWSGGFDDYVYDLHTEDGSVAPFAIKNILNPDNSPAGVVLENENASDVIFNVVEAPVQHSALQVGKQNAVIKTDSVSFEGESQLLLEAVYMKQKRLAGMSLNPDSKYAVEQVSRELQGLLESVAELTQLGESTDIPECVEVLGQMNKQLQQVIDTQVKQVRASIAVRSAVFSAKDDTGSALQLSNEGSGTQKVVSTLSAESEK